MRYKGKIKELNHIVISDPSYNKQVIDRYEKNNLKEKNWTIEIDIKEVEEHIEDYTTKGIEFFLLLSKYKDLTKLQEEGKIEHIRETHFKETKICVDTACIALGIDEKANEIIESQNVWQPECSINTLSDGLFGVVREGILNDETICLFVYGYLDEDTDYSIEDIIEYLQNQLNITDLNKQEDIDMDI